MSPTGLGRALLVLPLLAGCGPPEPRPIRYGQDVCAYCRMTITDPRYAAYLVTQPGRTYVFDDIGGLAAFISEGRVPPSIVHSVWVNRFLLPESLVDATQATYVESALLRSPMGTGFAAVGSPIEAESLMTRLGAGPSRIVSWAEILDGARAPTLPRSPDLVP